jgi:protein-tyrosine phosphatase
VRARLVDIHTHMVPSGDDGVKTIEEAVELCSAAAKRGTSLMYVTPHVNEDLPLPPDREALVRANAARLNELLQEDGLEVRVGFEIHPIVAKEEPDLVRYRLDSLDAVLLECPLDEGPRYAIEPIFSAAERVEAAGLLPVLAHPERSPAFLTTYGAANDAARRGWVLQVTAASLAGRDGEQVRKFAWSLLEEGHADVVASDAHRPDRPPFLDDAFRALAGRFGEARAVALLDGSALAAASTV